MEAPLQGARGHRLSAGSCAGSLGDILQRILVSLIPPQPLAGPAGRPPASLSRVDPWRL